MRRWLLRSLDDYGTKCCVYVLLKVLALPPGQSGEASTVDARGGYSVRTL